MSVDLTDERYLALDLIRGLAPDHATLRTADDLALSDKWGPAGVDEREGRLLWAEFPEARRPIHTAVILPRAYVTCTCTGARFPCRHALALMLRDEAGELDREAAPAWATRWVDGLRRAEIPDPAMDANTDTQRQAALRSGMADLSLWLNDLMRQGLATLPKLQRRPFSQAADRLVDAYAFEAARDLREIAALPGSGPDWPARLLPRLGRLALMAEGFSRIDDLPPVMRGDLLAAAGWLPRTADDRRHDRWLVLARRQVVEGKQRRLRTWLFGMESGRWALLADTWPAARLEGPIYPTGGIMSGELVFPPSSRPLLAAPADVLRLTSAAFASPRGTDVADAVAEYAAARAANPWLRLYPMLLQDVFVEPAGGRWRARDRSGHFLPLPERFGSCWQLLSLSGGRPVTLFGEWDGATFSPLSVAHNGWHDLAAWKGLP